MTMISSHAKTVEQVCRESTSRTDDAAASLGIGEKGAGVEPSPQERDHSEFQRLYRENGFHAFLSNNISLDRSIKDLRHAE